MAAVSTTDFNIDQSLLRQRYSRAASTARDSGFLARELASRMIERLDVVRLKPERVVDVGCGGGEDLALLAAHYPEADCIGVDFALPVLHAAQPRPSLLQKIFRQSSRTQFVCADAGTLPLARSSVQMVWSNLMLSTLAEPMHAFKEMHRVLAVDGLLMFATLGPDTLRELRAALPATQGERVHRFIDMHDIGDALVSAGFSEPVMDMDVLTLTYASLDDLLRDLRNSGATNAASTRPRGLSGKAGWKAARAAYETRRVDGRLPATVEVVFGHAWKPQPKVTEDGRAIIRFSRDGKPGSRP